MDFDIKLGGISIKDHIIEYNRNQQICNGIGLLDVVVENRNFNHNIKIWDEVTLFEEGHKKGTYVIANLIKSGEQGTLTLQCQDYSKKLVDYYLAYDNTNPNETTTRYWIELILNEVGINYIFTTTSSGSPVPPNSSFFMMSAYDAIISLLQQSGWYIYFDKDGKAIIGKLNISGTGSAITVDDSNILSIRRYRNDTRLRNRAVVWGAYNPQSQSLVTADVSVHTPWNYDRKDKRAIVLSNSTIYSEDTAIDLAKKMLNEFSTIGDEIIVELEGAYNIKLGDFVRVKSKWYTGRKRITTIESRGSSKGLITIITLNQKCPRLFTYLGYLGEEIPVYAGTYGSGVYKKDVASYSWFPVNSGLQDLHVIDLYVKGGIAACITTDGYLYYTETDSNVWKKFNHGDLYDADYNLFYESDIKAVSVSIDDSGNIVAGYAYSGSESRSWVLTISSIGELLRAEQIIYENQSNKYQNLRLVDLDIVGTPEEGVIESVKINQQFLSSYPRQVEDQPHAVPSSKVLSYANFLQCDVSQVRFEKPYFDVFAIDGDVLYGFTNSNGYFIEINLETRLTQKYINIPQGFDNVVFKKLGPDYFHFASFVKDSNNIPRIDIWSFNSNTGVTNLLASHSIPNYIPTSGGNFYDPLYLSGIEYWEITPNKERLYRYLIGNSIIVFVTTQDENNFYLCYGVLDITNPTSQIRGGRITIKKSDFPPDKEIYYKVNAVFSGVCENYAVGGMVIEYEYKEVIPPIWKYPLKMPTQRTIYYEGIIIDKFGNIKPCGNTIFNLPKDEDGIVGLYLMISEGPFGVMQGNGDVRILYPAKYIPFNSPAGRWYSFVHCFSPSSGEMALSIMQAYNDGYYDGTFLHVYKNRAFPRALDQSATGWRNVASKLQQPFVIGRYFLVPEVEQSPYELKDCYIVFIHPDLSTSWKKYDINNYPSNILASFDLVFLNVDDLDGSVFLSRDNDHAYSYTTNHELGWKIITNFGQYMFFTLLDNIAIARSPVSPLTLQPKGYILNFKGFSLPLDNYSILKHQSVPSDDLVASLGAKEVTKAKTEYLYTIQGPAKVEISKGAPTLVYTTPTAYSGQYPGQLYPIIAVSFTNTPGSFRPIFLPTNYVTYDARIFDIPEGFIVQSGFIPPVSLLERYILLAAGSGANIIKYDLSGGVKEMINISVLTASGSITTIETTNYTLEPYIFLGISGDSPRFFQRVEGITYFFERSNGLPITNNNITIIRADDDI